MITSQLMSFIYKRSIEMFDLLLDMMYHRYGSNQNDGRNYLMCVKTSVEKTPGDADCGERLHHFKVTGR